MGVTYTHPQGTPNNGQKRSVIAGDGSARVTIYNTNLPGNTYYTGGVYIVGGQYSGASYDGSTLSLTGTTVAGYGGQPGTAGSQTAYWSASWGSGSWSGGYGGYVTWAYSAPGAPNAPSVSRSSNGTSLTATTGGGSGRITYYNVALNGVTGWNANGTTFSVDAHTTYTVISLAGNEDNSTQGGSTTSYGIPNSPGTPSVSPNTSVSGRIDVSWSAPSYVGGGILEYHVYRNGSYVNTTTSTSYADTGLTPGSSYSYTVYARNSTGWGPVSGTSSAATANGVPSAPNSFSVANNTSVAGRIDLAWSVPSTVYTGVTSYKIYRNGLLLTSTTSTSYSNTGLSPNTSYSYYVTAVNSVGEGSATSTLSATTNDVPSAPRDFTVTNNTSVPGRIDLTWTVPSLVYTGVTSYKIYRDGSFLTSTTSTSYANTGLNYNTSYSYYVRAVNSVGEGSATATLSATTTGTPTSPRNFTATPLGTASDTGKIKLDWIAPDPATTYGTVTAYTLKRGTTQIYSGTNLTFTDTGLTSGTTYTYTVTVTNSSNLTSPEVSASAMAPGVPSAPRTFTATPNSTVAGRIDLAWIAPATTNGTITGYDVYRKLSTDANYPGTPTTVINGAATLSQTYTGLTLGATYNFKVVARNAFADSSGLRSAEATATAMAPTVPSAPLNVVATSSASVSGRIDLSWVTPTNTYGTITGYDIYYKLTSAGSYPTTPNKTTTGTSTVTDITGLTVGSYYDFKIKARNSFADTSGDRSDFSDAATNALAPGLANAPVLSSATPSLTKLGEVTLSWVAPTIPAGTITQYYVYATISGQSPVLWTSVSGTTTSTTLTGLAQRQTYSFSVRAVNGWPTASPGTSPASNSIDARSPGAALAPTNLTASVPTNLSGTVNLSWTAPTDVGATGASIVGYGVYFSDNAVIVENTGSATTNYQVTGLVPNIEYYFYVRALNTISALPNNEDGIKSSTIGATPVGAPKAPLSPFITTSTSVAGRLTIGWSANPAETTSITGYNVFYADGTFVGTTTGTTLVVDNLSSDITYSFYIKARNLVTDTAGITGGDSSTTVSARPGSTSTQALPTTVTVTNNTNTVLTGQSTVTSLTSNTVSFSKSASDIPSASVPASASSVLTNNTNTIINGTYSVVSTPTTDKITYNRVGPNFSSTSTPSGTATNTTNAVFSGTYDITDINVDNKTISYNKTASTVTSRAVPLTPLATVSNTTSTVYNANNASITAVTEDTFSYAKTNANIEESIATGTVVNNTNRYIYNGTYTVTGIPAYNEFTYSTGDDVSRVNLAINPSMERVGTGTDILRTNHYTNPRMANSTAGWTVLAPGATQTPDVNGTRIDFSDDVAPLEAFFYETSAMPIATGEYAVASIELTVPPGYPSLKLKSTLRSYGAGDAEVKTITVGTGQTVRLDSGVYLTSTTSSGVRNLIGATETIPAGARLVVRNAIFEKTNVLGEYFDGATADAKGWDFAWSGTADASKSYAKAQAVVVRKNQITNPGLEATSTGELVRTNIITNPSFEAALTGWTDSATGMTSSRTTSQAYSGAASLQMISTLTNAYSISPAMSVSASDTYTASAWVKGTSGKLVGITIRELNSGGSTVGDTNSSNFTLNGSWQRISVTRNLTSAAVSAQVLLIDRTASNAGQTFYADDILFEDSAFLGDYFSGATADGYGLNYAWTGTVDASTSTATTSSVYATNLATNPSGEAVQSGTVVLRTNLLDNPTPSETGSTDWAITSPGTGGVYSVTYEADGFTALTTTQPSDANFTIQIGATSGLTGRTPVEAGKTYTVSATVVSSINDVRSTGMVWYSATGVNLGVVYSTKRSLVANVPQRVSHTAVAPAEAVSATMVVVSSGGSGLSSQIRTVGSTISAKEALFEQTDQLREYFSGATTDALGWAYDWTGLANESSSTAKAQSVAVRNNLLTNPSMESTQTGLLVATNLVTNPSMETTSGTVTVRTNLATNPSMETVSTGTTVLRTNLITNPSFEVDTTGWQSNVTITRVAGGYLGGYCAEATGLAPTQTINNLPSLAVTSPNRTYMGSVWVKAPVGKLFFMQIREYMADGVTQIGTTDGSLVTATGSWQRVSLSRTFGPTGERALILVRNLDTVSYNLQIDAAMIEASSTLNDYFDGSTTDALGWDYAWSGTANASTSTASALASVVRENLVTNPAMESVTSGSTVLRTNLVTNPSFEVNTTGWTLITAGAASISRVTSDFYTGTASGQVVSTALNGGYGAPLAPVSVGTTYTASAWVKGEAGKLARIQLDWSTSADTYISQSVFQFTATGAWQRVQVSGTAPSEAANGKVGVINRTSGAHTFLIDAVQLEEGSFATPYFDGSTPDALGWDYAWSGTANASTSTAAASAVDVRTNLATNPSFETVSPGTTVHRRNLTLNPNFEVDTAGWYGAGATISRDTGTYYSGVASLKVVAAGQWNDVQLASTISATPNTTYTVSYRVKGEAGKSLNTEIYQSSGGTLAGSSYSTTGSWQYPSFTFTTSSTATNIRLVIKNYAAATHTFYVDEVLIEQASAVGDYFDGSTTDALGWDYAWSGTAGNSISTAAASTVTTRTNLITNPSMETSSTGELVRTNLALYPNVAATTGWGGGNTGGALSLYTGGSPLGNANAARITMAGTTTNNAFATYGGLSVSAVSGSVTYMTSMYVRSSRAVTIQLNTVPYTSADVYAGGEVYGTATLLVANAWTRLNVAVTTPANTGYLQVRARLANVETWQSGDTLDMSCVLIEQTSQLNPYFDGSSTDADGVNYAWSGTANSSTSTATTASLIATNLLTNPDNLAVATGTTVLRSNLARNPRQVTGGANSEQSSRYGWTLSYLTGLSGLADGITTAARWTNVEGAGSRTGRGVDLGQNADVPAGTSGNTLSYPVTGGSSIRFSAYVRWSVAVNSSMWIRFHDGAGNWVGDATASGSNPQSANAWHRVSHTATAPTGAYYAIARITTNAAATFVGSDTLDITGILVEQTDQTRSYFDGDLADSLGWDYGWSGTVNNSISTAKASSVVVRENSILNPSMENNAQGELVRTNLIPNPSFAVDVTNWNANYSTVARTVMDKYVGDSCAELTLNANSSAGVYSSVVLISPNTTYTASAYMRDVDAGVQFRVGIEWYTSANVFISAAAAPGTSLNTGGWTRLTYTALAPATAAKALVTIYATSAPVAGKKVRLDAVLFEVGLLNKFFDGSFVSGGGLAYAWSGTANASTSTATTSYAYATNLVTNPQFNRVATGTSVLRRNLALNPSATGAGAGSNIGSAPVTTTVDTTIFRTGTSALRRTNTGAGTPGFGFTISDAIYPGETISWSLWVYSSIATSFNPYWERGTPSYTGGVGGSTVSVPANTWTKVTGTKTFDSSTSGSAYKFGLYGTASFATGDYIVLDECLIERCTLDQLGDYFDGSTAASLGWTYSWSGTADASVSHAAASAIWMRTNFCPNPGFETNTTGWSAAGATISRDTATVYNSSTGSLKIVAGAGTYTGAAFSFTPEANKTYTYSAYIWAPSGMQINFAGDAIGVNTTLVGNGAWQRVSVTGTPTSATAGTMYIRAIAANAGTFYVDNVLLEKSTTANDYFDGSYTVRNRFAFGWSGTAHNSTSYQWGTAVADIAPYYGGEGVTYQSLYNGKPAASVYRQNPQGQVIGFWIPNSQYYTETTAYFEFVAPAGTPVYIGVRNSNGGDWGNASATATGSPQTLRVFAQAPNSNEYYAIGAQIIVGGNAGQTVLTVLKAMFLQGHYNGPYFDGSTGSQFGESVSWSGTAFASTSSRALWSLSKWEPINGASIYQSPAYRANNRPYAAAVECSGSMAGQGLEQSQLSVATPTSVQTASAYVYVPSGTTISIELAEWSTTAGYIGVTANTIAGNGAWQRVSVTRSFGSTGDRANVRIYTTTASNVNFWVDDVMIEKAPSAGTYFDGNTGVSGDMYATVWSGTTSASSSQMLGATPGGNWTVGGETSQVMYKTSSGFASTVTNTLTGGGRSTYVDGLVIGRTYTIKLNARKFGTTTVLFQYAWNSSALAWTNSFAVYTYTFQALQTRLYLNASSVYGDGYEIEAFMLVEGTYSGPYFDGGTNYESADTTVAWTGTAHNSTSTLSANPVTDWTGILGADVYQSNVQKYLGTYSAKVVCNGVTAGQGASLIARKTVVASGTYTASVWVFAEAGKNVQIELEEWTTAGGYVGSTLGTSTAGTGAWMRLSVTRTFGSTGTRAEINVKNVAAVAHNFYVDAALLEESDTLQSYFDGTFSPSGDFSYAWAGTANASQSIQRAAVVAGVTALSICVAVQSFEWDSTGAKSLRLVPTSTTANNSWVRFDIPTVIGTSYTARVKMRLTQALTGSLWPNSRRINVYNTGLSVVIAQSSQATNAAGVYDLTVTFTAEATATPILIGSGARAGNGDVWIDDFIVEKTSTIQGYFDGSTGSYDAALQRVWSGAPHASTSIIRGPQPVAFGGPNNSSAIATTERSYSGDDSVKVFYGIGSAGIVGLSYTVSLTTGTTYTASAWVYTPAGSVLPQFNIQSPGFAGATGTAATLYDTWQRISVTFTTNSTATYYIYILNSAGTTAGQFFYVDNFVLEAASAVLPYFDGATQPDLSGDTVVTWTGTAHSSISRQLGAGIAGWTSSQARSQSYSGSASMVCYSTSVQSNGQYTWISVSPSTTYTASAWVKAEVGKLFRMRLMELNGGSYIGENGTVDITGTGSWQRVSVTSTFGASANTARIYFENRTTGAHTFYVDAVLLEVSPVVQDYFDGSIVSADADLTNSWSGTAHASTSVMRGTGVVGATVGGSNTPVSSTIWSSSGSKSLRIFTPVGGSNNDIASLNLTVGTTYTIQAKIYIPTIYAGTPTLLFGVRTFGGSTAEHNTAILNQTGVQSLSVTFTVSSGTTSVSPRIWVIGATGLGQIFVDNLIVVQGNYTGEYFDGNTEDSDGLVLAWTGAANASTSTATTGTLYATNRVLNPSMETVASGATTLRTNLVTNPNMEVVAWPGYGSGSGATLSTIQSYIGTQSTKTAPTLSGLKGITMGSFPSVTGGAKYTLSAWVYRESGASLIGAYIEWLTSGGSYITSSFSNAVTVPVGVWTRIYVTATAPASAGQAALDVLFNSAVAGSDVMYVDAVLLEQTDQLRDYFDGSTTDALGWDYGWSGTANASTSTAKATAVTLNTNLVTNPSFEVNTTGWGNNQASLAISSANSYVGTKSGIVTCNAASSAGAYFGTTRIPVSAGSTYTASVYALDINTSVQFSARIEWYNAATGGTRISITYGTATTINSTTWTRLSVTGTAPTGATHGVFSLYSVTAPLAGSQMYVDAAQFETGSTASPYFDGSTGASGDGYYTAWTGTANASTSVQYGVAPQGWGIANGPGAITSLSRGQDSDGTKFIRYNRPTNDTVGTWRVMYYTYSGMFDNLNIGTYVTLLMKVRASTSTSLNFGVLRGDGLPGGNYGSSQTIGTSWSWVRYYVPLTTNNEANMWMYSGFPMGTGSYVDIAEALAVTGKYTGPYFTGSSDPDVDSTVAWTGTPHASTSTLSVTPVRNWIGTYGAVVHQSSLQTKDSSYAAKVYCNGDASIQGTQLFTRSSVSASTEYTASAWVLGEAGKTLRIDLQELTSAGVLVGTTSSADIVATGSWQRISVSRTMGATASTTNVAVSNVGATTHTFYLDAAMLERGPVASEYFDGDNPSLGDFEYLWTGTANQSTSIQRAVIPAGVGDAGMSSLEWSASGSRSIKVFPTTADNNSFANIANMLPAPSTLAGKVCTMVGTVRVPAALTGTLHGYSLKYRLWVNLSTGGTVDVPVSYTSTAGATAGVYEVRGTFTMPAAATTWSFARIYNGASAGNGEVWWDNLVLTEGAYTGQTFSGDTADTDDFAFAWDGTPHASTSTFTVNPATNWTGVNGAVIYQTAVEKYIGTHSGQVSCSGSVGLQGARLISRSTVSASTLYYASAWVKGTAGKTLRIELQEYTATGTYIGGTASSNVTATGSWQRISVSRTMGSTGTRADVVISNVAATSHNFYVDAVMLEAASSLQNYFDGNYPASGDYSYTWNGTAEASTSQFQAPSVGSTSSTGAYAIQSSQWASNGTRSLRVISTTAATNSASVNFTPFITSGLEPGKTYTVKAKVYRAQAGARVGLLAYHGYVATTLTQNVSANIPTAIGTHEVSITFTVGLAIEDARLLIFSNQVAGAADIWIDDFFIVEGAYTGDYFDGDTTGTGGAFPILYNWQGTPHNSSSIRDVGGNAPAGGAAILSPYGDAERVNSTAALEIQYRSGWLG